MESIEKGKYPDGVIDKEAYDEYVKYSKHPSFVPATRLIHTSDPDIIVDPGMIKNHIVKIIDSLPDDEQQLIFAKIQAYRSITGKMVSLRNKAFGLKHNGPYSFMDSILDPKKSEIIELFGRLYSSKEVHKIVTQDWGYEIGYKAVEAFKARYRDEIKEAQEQYMQNYSDNRLSYKKSRLEELLWLYNHRKELYETSKSKTDYELLLKTLEQIRKEVDPNELTVNVKGELQILHTMNNTIKNEVMKNLSVMDIIIGRIAAQKNINPTMLIARLHSSFYARFSGFQGVAEDLEKQKPIYPSEFVYNFDEIKTKNDTLAKKDIEEAKIVEIKPGESIKAQSVRELLKKKLQEKKEAVNTKLDKIDKLRKKNEE